MTKKIIFLVCLFASLVGVALFEQIYTEDALKEITTEVSSLQSLILEKDLDKSFAKVEEVESIWADKEKIICLFVDYRDIEQIGKQANLVKTHLLNNDFQLAKVECFALQHAIDNFTNMVKFDFFNIF